MLELTVEEILNLQSGLSKVISITDNAEYVKEIVKEGLLTKDEVFNLSYRIMRYTQKTKPEVNAYNDLVTKLTESLSEWKIDDKTKSKYLDIGENQSELKDRQLAMLKVSCGISGINKIKLSELKKLGVGAGVLLSLSPIVENDIDDLVKNDAAEDAEVVTGSRKALEEIVFRKDVKRIAEENKKG